MADENENSCDKFENDSAKPDKMFTLKKWNAVAMWSWDVECDTCAICRVQVMGKCHEFFIPIFCSTIGFYNRNRLNEEFTSISNIFLSAFYDIYVHTSEKECTSTKMVEMVSKQISQFYILLLGISKIHYRKI
jgi:RING-box protein 2